jgi:hypothetical protein
MRLPRPPDRPQAECRSGFTRTGPRFAAAISPVVSSPRTRQPAPRTNAMSSPCPGKPGPTRCPPDRPQAERRSGFTRTGPRLAAAMSPVVSLPSIRQPALARTPWRVRVRASPDLRADRPQAECRSGFTRTGPRFAVTMSPVTITNYVSYSPLSHGSKNAM